MAGPSPANRGAGAAWLRAAVRLATLAGWLALIAAMCGQYGWLLELFAHFRVHYVVAFAALACMALVQRARLVAGAAVAGFVASAAPVLAYLEPIAPSSAAHAPGFRLVSLNVRYTNDDLTDAAAFLEESQADLIVLQEVTRGQAQQLEQLLVSYPHRHIDADWRGAAVYSRWPLAASRWESLADGASRAAAVELDWRGARIALLGVHLHWPLSPGEARIRNAQLERLAIVAAAATTPLLVAGDFNVTPWSPHFRRTLAASGLKDCALGQGLAPSWPSPATWLGIRIDHCLASPHWRVLDARIGPHVGSDHRPVIVELALESS